MATKAELEAEVAALRKDIALIGRTLKAQANHRGWCTDYESVMSRLNQKLTYPIPNASRILTEAHYEIGMRINVELRPNAYMAHHLPEAYVVASNLNGVRDPIRQAVAEVIGQHMGRINVTFEAIEMVDE